MRNFISSSQMSTPSRYRSVRYKTISKESNIDEHNPSQIELPEFVKNKNARKLSEKRDRKNYSEFTTLYSNNKRAKIKTESSELQKSLQKIGYMQSYHCMMESNKNYKTVHMLENNGSNERANKINQGLRKAVQKRNMRPGKNFPLRVRLPILHETDSHFTVLDHINLPIDYINEQIKKNKEGMKIQEKQIKAIGKQLEMVGNRMNDEFEQIGESITKGFDRLKGLLLRSVVYHQESQLKLKQAFDKNAQFLPSFYEDLEKCKNDCRNLQETIFSGFPFELKENEELGETLESKYF